MDISLEKMMRIVNDTVAFCHGEGAAEYQIFMKQDTDMLSVTISCPIEDISQEAIDQIHEELSIPRQHDIEQNYWELSGESEFSDGLTFVGMMIDEAEVGYRDGVLYIHMWRKS